MEKIRVWWFETIELDIYPTKYQILDPLFRPNVFFLHYMDQRSFVFCIKARKGVKDLKGLQANSDVFNFSNLIKNSTVFLKEEVHNRSTKEYTERWALCIEKKSPKLWTRERKKKMELLWNWLLYQQREWKKLKILMNTPSKKEKIKIRRTVIHLELEDKKSINGRLKKNKTWMISKQKCEVRINQNQNFYHNQMIVNN